MPSRSRSSRRRCSGALANGVEVTAIARVQVGDDEPADVVQQRGDRELVAILPADRAADLVGGLLGGEGVDAEALGPHLAAAVGLEEVEYGSGAGDREDAGGLEHVDRRGDAPMLRPVPPLRLAKRSTEIARPTSASTASTSSPRRAVSAVAAFITRARDSIRTGNFSTASKAAARRAPGAGLPSPLRARRRASPCRCCVASWFHGGNRLRRLIGSQGRTV